MKCPACKADIPDNSTFCLSCGRPLTADGLDLILPPDGSKTEERATLYMVFAIMCLFFGFFLLIPGYFVGMGLIVPASCLVVLGFVLLAARYYILRRYAKRVERLRKESAERVPCKYCGSLNLRTDEKCIGCGAPLT